MGAQALPIPWNGQWLKANEVQRGGGDCALAHWIVQCARALPSTYVCVCAIIHSDGMLTNNYITCLRVGWF